MVADDSLYRLYATQLQGLNETLIKNLIKEQIRWKIAEVDFLYRRFENTRVSTVLFVRPAGDQNL